jgi:hypothetical protein
MNIIIHFDILNRKINDVDVTLVFHLNKNQIEQASDHKDELGKLEREIDMLSSHIAKVEPVTDNNRPTAEAKKKSIWDCIKERWNNFADTSKQWNNIIGFAEKMKKIVVLIATIDWTALLKSFLNLLM